METIILIILVYIAYKAIRGAKDQKNTQAEIPKVSYRVKTGDTGERPRREQTLKQTGDECWVPSGKEVVVQGYTLPRGMIYVGRGLYVSRGYGQKERCLIDPTAPVEGPSAGHHVGELSYYPSYVRLTPSQRGRYLEWLSRGAKDPDIPIGYAFLYFYGLERRLIKDDPGDEGEKLVAEVKRLRHLFSDQGSFNGYSARLIAAAQLKGYGPKVYQLSPELASRSNMTTLTKLAIGQLVAERKPIPAKWMLAWLYEDEKTRLRTPARRAEEEFVKLFKIRFEEAYPEGFVLKPNKTKLSLSYRAASGTFYEEIASHLPDVSRLSRPQNEVRPILEACCDELDAYSRLLGRDASARGTRAAVARLPAELAKKELNTSSDAFLKWLEDLFEQNDYPAVSFAEVSRRWVKDESRLRKSGALRKRDAEALSSYLDIQRIGIEPDIRRTGKVPSVKRRVVFFELQERSVETSPRPRFRRAALVLRLIVMVAQADDSVEAVERDHLISHIQQAQELSPREQERLKARLKYLLANPPTLRGVREAVEEKLSEQGRKNAAQFALLTAVADGRLDPDEVDLLEKLYDMLGQDPSSIYSDLHTLGARDGPVTVRKAQPGGTGHPIPPPQEDEEKQDDRAGIELDMELVKKKMHDTKQASAMLEHIFREDEERSIEDESYPQEDDANEKVADALVEDNTLGLFSGLSEAQADLLSQLLSAPTWSREDYESEARARGLMPSGALEAINEWAFEQFDEPLLEEDETIYVYQDIWEDYCHGQQTN